MWALSVASGDGFSDGLAGPSTGSGRLGSGMRPGFIFGGYLPVAVLGAARGTGAISTRRLRARPGS